MVIEILMRFVSELMVLQGKVAIFNNLVIKMVEKDKMNQKQIKCKTTDLDVFKNLWIFFS